MTAFLSRFSSLLLHWSLLFGCAINLVANAHAANTINFVQLTDPHFFEKQRLGADEIDNFGAFAVCIGQINRLDEELRTNTNSGFDFVVLTGDFGLEELSNDPVLWTNELAVVAAMIARSAVTNWLVVPGNNDLTDERPETIWKYHAFVDGLRTQLAGNICVTNLCPPPSPNQTNASSSADFPVGKNGHFIGFDNACFKSNNRGTNATNWHSVQLDRVHQVTNTLAKVNSNHFVYMFYHIPEIDDPYSFHTKQTWHQERQTAGDDRTNSYSAWLVSRDVRDEWDKVVANPGVRGLIAGHFHSDLRNEYLDFKWLQAPGLYRSVAAEKLFISPPVAVKNQTNWNAQARGFRIYSVDANSGVMLSSNIFWYEGFSTNGMNHSSIRALLPATDR